jgi:hypothetical protein
MSHLQINSSCIWQSTCYGNINPSTETFTQNLGTRSDSEILILTDGGAYSMWKGFDTDVNGIGACVVMRGGGGGGGPRGFHMISQPSQ